MLIGYYLPVLIYEPLIDGPLIYERLSYGLLITGYQLRAINYGLSITGYQLRAISYGLYSPERAACISQHLGLGNVH